jgi:enoyl-CoA hydratase
MSWSHIEVERRGRIGIVRLNRPRYRNAQSWQMLEEMTEAFAELDLDSEVRVIVLCGAGEDFSAGHDAGTPEHRAAQAQAPFGAGAQGQVNLSWHLYVENSLRWRDVRKPTIAQVQGYCIWGGFLVASCMDIIIASDDAKFLSTQLQLFTAPWDLGIRAAKRILFENRFIHADEALRLGLVSEVVPRERLEEATMAQAERWAANSLMTLRMLKQSINLAQDAMGYRFALHASHANSIINGRGLAETREADVGEGRRPIRHVAEALAKDRRRSGRPGERP